MKNLDVILPTVALFKDIDAKELASMLECLQARTVEYKKGATLLAAGNRPEQVGIVISGRLHIARDDMDGNRTLIATLTEADIFAEALCCAGVDESPVTVLADGDVTVLLMQFSRILYTCSNTCVFHQKLISNMLRIVAQKNLYMQNRMEIVCIRTIRAKVLAYLGALAAKHGHSFTVPHNREEMADYLCVERSALSHELSRMKREGLIEYRKNQFILI